MKPLLLDRLRVIAPLALKEAVPFVTDIETVTQAFKLGDIPELLKGAILPFPRTWLEFEVIRPSHEVGPSIRMGVLCITLTSTQGRWVAHLFDDDARPGGAPLRAPFGFMYSPLDETLRSGRLLTEWETEKKRTYIEPLIESYDRTFKRMAFGEPPEVWPWTKAASVIFQPETTAKMMAEAEDYAEARVGVGTVIPSLLALIAHGPAKQRLMRPSGRWIDRAHHTTRAHTVHTVVSIEVGEKVVYQTVRNALHEAARRRQHDVRSHPRRIRKGRPDEYTVMVHSHKRGDPAIGTVIHDAYMTTRTERD